MNYKEKKYNYGSVKFCDCLDEEHGMFSLPDKSFDLGYTDPPWGVDMHKDNERQYQGKTLKFDKTKEYFKDSFRPEWNLTWFKELERVCNGVILVIPEKHKYWWIRNTKPRGDLIIHWRNGFAMSSIANHSQKSTYLFYGKFKNRLYRDVIDSTLIWGFLKRGREKFIHPSPKGTEIILKILKELKPKSVIDSFIGSGSYGQACEILGIPWLGYEINELYADDIDLRMESINTTKSGIKYWLKPT